MKLDSLLLTFTLLFWSFGSNQLLAKSTGEKQFEQLNAQIEHFVTNKQYAQAIDFCNEKISETSDETLKRFLLVSKLRLFTKSKTFIDSVPATFNNQLALKENSDSLSYFLSARAQEILGHYYYVKGDIENALANLNLADSLYGLTTAYEYRIYNLDMLGTMYLLTNNLTDGLITLTRADRMLGTYLPKDSALHIDLHIDIGLVYFKLRKYETAKTYYKPLLTYSLTQEQEAQTLNNLAIIAIEEKEYKKEATYLSKARELYLEIGDKNDLARIYSNLGSALENLDFPVDTVVSCYAKSISLRKELQDSVGLIAPMLNLAGFYFKLDDFKKLESTIEQLLPFKKHFVAQDFATFYYLNTFLAENKKNYSDALKFYKFYHLYTDTVQQIENAWLSTKAESDIELEKKEGSLNLLQKENDLAKIKTRQQRIIILAISAISFLLILALLIAVRFFYRRQLLEKKLRNKEVKLASVANLVRGQEDERLRIAKDLHDGVGNNLAMIRAEILKDTSYNKEYLAALVTQTSEEVRNITHDLMPIAIKKFGLVEAINDLVVKWKNTNRLLIDVNYQGNIDIDKNTSLTLYRIVQELLKNAVTHGLATYVVIIISQNNQELSLIFEDNGIGMADDKLNQRTGIGISNVAHRVSYLNGEMTISKQNKGLKYTFVFRENRNENTNSR